MQQQPVTSPARLPNRLLGGRPSQNRSSSMDEPDVYNMHTYSMPFQASKPQLEDGVQPANLLYVCTLVLTHSC